MGNVEESERSPLLQEGSRRSRPVASITAICLLIFVVGCIAVAAAISLSFGQANSSDSDHPNTTTSRGPGELQYQLFASYVNLAADTFTFSVFSLMVWGSPGSFGVLDKELRMAAIGQYIAADTDHDVFLLNDVRRDKFLLS